MRPCLAPWLTVSSRTVSCLASMPIEEYGKLRRPPRTSSRPRQPHSQVRIDESDQLIKRPRISP